MKHIYLVIVMVTLITFSTACGGQSLSEDREAEEMQVQEKPTPADSSDSTQQAAPTLTEVKPTPTTPKATLTPTTEIAEAFSLQELIYYGDKGGGDDCYPLSQLLPIVYQIPAMGDFSVDIFTTCLVGFPPGELVELVVIDPHGQEIPWMEIRIPDLVVTDFKWYEEPFTQVGLNGFRTLALGSPNWQLMAKYTGGTVTNQVFGPQEGIYLSEYWWKTNERAVTQSRFASGSMAHPFDPLLRRPYETGETVYIQGVNFTPNRTILLGIYMAVEERCDEPPPQDSGLYNCQMFQLISSLTADTDTQGSFETSTTIRAEFKNGYYYIFYIDPGDPDNSAGEATLAYDSVFRVYEKQSFEESTGKPGSSLRIGSWAVGVGDLVGNLRSRPGISDKCKVIGKILPGEQVLLLDGPSYADGYIWWEVWVQESRLIGYTAEGDGIEQWLAPLE